MRKPFFKAVVAGMASVAMIAGMSACGRSANNADSDSDAVKTIDSSKATGDLTIWAMGNEGDLLGDFVKGFEKENPDVKVKVTAIPWSSAHDKLQTAIAAGNGPDLAQIGTTLEVDDAKTAEQVKQYLPSIRSGILMLVSQRTSSELLQREGKEKLANDILREVSRPLGYSVPSERERAKAAAAAEHDGDAEERPAARKRAERNPVRRVLFSSFIIQ